MQRVASGVVCVLGADYRGGICVLLGLVALSIAISWFVQGKHDLRAMEEHLRLTCERAVRLVLPLRRG